MTVSEAQSRRRQPSIHLFALEYAQATLPEGRGSTTLLSSSRNSERGCLG